jgi:hypothetical protein
LFENLQIGVAEPETLAQALLGSVVGSLRARGALDSCERSESPREIVPT